MRDVLSEGTPADFQEALLTGTLRLARRRRIYRRARNVSAGLALIAVCAFLGGTYLPRQSHGPRPTEGGFVLIGTRPMAAGAIIGTRPFDPARITSSVASATIVRTSRGIFRVIDDRELLALVSPRPVVLIRAGAAAEQLEFVNAEDNKILHTE